MGLECLWYDVTQSRTANYWVLEGARDVKMGCGGSGSPFTPFGLTGFGLEFLHVHLSAFPSFHVLSTFLPFFPWLSLQRKGNYPIWNESVL